MKRFKYRILCSIQLLLLLACATGQKPKSTLNYLNGENYGTAQQALTDPAIPVPIGGRTQSRTSVINGIVRNGTALDSQALRGIELGLFNSRNEEILTATSDADGSFSFYGVLANGGYVIRSKAPHYRGELNVTLDGYKVDGVTVVLTNH